VSSDCSLWIDFLILCYGIKKFVIPKYHYSLFDISVANLLDLLYA